MKMISKFVNACQTEINTWVEAIVCHLPGRLGSLCRRYYYDIKFFEARSVHIGAGSRFVGSSSISVGARVSFGLNNYLNAVGGSILVGHDTVFNSDVYLNSSVGGTIEIGSYCLIGPKVIFRTASHNCRDKSVLIRYQGHKIGNIVLEEDVWIGAGAILLGGITISKGAVVGAGAVVTKDIPPFSIAVGVPAVVIAIRT